MTTDPQILISESFKKPEKIIRKLNSRRITTNYYVVGYRLPSDRLEIYATRQFVQQNFPLEDLTLIAVYKTEEEALELIRKLSEISVRHYGATELLRAFKEHREELFDE